MKDLASEVGPGVFVRKALVESTSPPPNMSGFVAWARENLFSGWFNIAMTIFCVAFILFIVPPLLRFLLIEAAWTGTSRDACLKSWGACWPFVYAKFGQFIYGFYPAAERWRPNIVFVVGGLLLLPLLIPAAPLKRINAILFFGIFPFVAFVLLTGGNLNYQNFLIGHIFPLNSIFEGSIYGLGFAFWIDFLLSSVLLIAAVALLEKSVLGATHSGVNLVASSSCGSCDRFAISWF